jgi:putative transposase
VKLPARSPNLNVYAERFVRTIKESCLERLILFGEGSIRRAVSEFTVHYHRERNHQGLDNHLICPDPKLVREGGEVKRSERLGGLLNYYYRAAA